jgi:hypothetical protein
LLLPENMLFVKVIQAQNLDKSKGAFAWLSNNIDSRIRLNLGLDTAVSKIISNNSNPVWNEEFRWNISISKHMILTITIEDVYMLGSTELGSINVYLRDFELGPQQRWFPLPGSGEVEIYLELGLQDDDEELPVVKSTNPIRGLLLNDNSEDESIDAEVDKACDLPPPLDPKSVFWGIKNGRYQIALNVIEFRSIGICSNLRNSLRVEVFRDHECRWLRSNNSPLLGGGYTLIDEEFLFTIDNVEEIPVSHQRITINYRHLPLDVFNATEWDHDSESRENLYDSCTTLSCELGADFSVPLRSTNGSRFRIQRIKNLLVVSEV